MKVLRENKKGFLDFFPAPRFLGMPAPALAVSDSSVRFIELEKAKKGLTFKRYGKEVMPEGIVVSGQIKDSEALSKILGGFRKNHDIKHIRSTLPAEKGYVFTAELPANSSKDLRTSVEFIIEENVPLSVSEVVFDYDILKIGDVTSNDGIHVSVSVIPIDAVNMYLDVFHSAGLSPLHFELESQAVSRSVVPANIRQPVLVIHLCRSKIGFYIVYGGAVNFSSTTSIDLAPIISEDSLKKAKGREDIKKEDALIFYPAAANIKSEMDKVFLFWESQKDKWGEKGEDISHIIVCGSYADVPGIRHYASNNGISAEVANVWVNAFSFENYIPPIPSSQALGYSSVIGLVLPRGS